LAGKWMEHHVKWSKLGSERQRWHVFFHLASFKHISTEYVSNSGSVKGDWGRREEKEMVRVDTIEIYHICIGTR
jgi:hypothetical protein